MGQAVGEKGRDSTQVSDVQEMGLAHLMAIVTAEAAGGHYVRNSNRRHGSETRTKTIVSDLEK
jgi:hypothetical protein